MTQVQSALQVMARVAGNKYYRSAVECPEYTQAVKLRQEVLKMQTMLPAVQLPAPPTAGDDLTEWLDAVAAAAADERDRAAKHVR